MWPSCSTRSFLVACRFSLHRMCYNMLETIKKLLHAGAQRDFLRQMDEEDAGP